MRREDYEKVFEELKYFAEQKNNETFDTDDFLDYKFPPKINYTGKVWKNIGWIGMVTNQGENGYLHG